ncbi:MAG: aldose epimerase family protein [Candidatus Thorarchaeota archaeon]
MTSMSWGQRFWGYINNQPVELHIFEDSVTGFQVSLSNFGATLVRMLVPDRKGKLSDITFGHNSPAEYRKHRAYFGAVVGRVTGRISQARFTLDGDEYSLAKNADGKHNIHGGLEGFPFRIWERKRISSKGKDTTIEFQYVSEDGEEGFPGTLTLDVTYYIRPMRLAWEFSATTDKTTIVNISNHAYWNLDGLHTTVDNQRLVLHSDRYMLADDDNMVTGEVAPVRGTGVDLNSGRLLKDVFQDFGDIDHAFFASGYDQSVPQRVNLCAELYSENTGRKMMVTTTEPCLVVYSGNHMEGIPTFNDSCQKHSAICLETQRVPNAINLPEYSDSVILKPTETYFQRTVHEFSIE